MRFYSKTLEQDVLFCGKHWKLIGLAKLATFWTNHHVLVFPSSFQQKVAKKCVVREKPWKLIETLAMFRTNNHIVGLSLGFQEKVARKCVILWKTMKTHRFGHSQRRFKQNSNVSRKLPCFMVFTTFQQSCKKCGILWKTIKTHRFR